MNHLDGAHIQFQSLSACEAMQLSQHITQTIIDAYQLGMNVILANYDNPIADLLDANHKALVNLGFNVDRERSAGILTFQLEQVTSKEVER